MIIEDDSCLTSGRAEKQKPARLVVVIVLVYLTYSDDPDI